MSTTGCSLMMIAGEASGDHYSAGLIRRLKEKQPQASIWGMGGDAMKAEGMDVIQNIKGLDVMGFWDVFKNIRTFRRVFAELRAEMEARQPDAVILVDYPGFNIRFARAAHSAGIPVVYFISPKVWAWNSGRIAKLAETVTEMLVFFDFEKDVYKGSGLDVVCVGHPLAEELEQYRGKKEKFRAELGIPQTGAVVGILPGSREREIRRMFPSMLEAAALLQDTIGSAEYIAACAPTLETGFLESFVSGKHPDITVLKGRSREIVAASDVLMITSGTATLEAGIIGVPHLICYRVGLLTYILIKPLLRTEHVGLVNIAAGEKVAEELLQGDMTPARIAETAAKLMNDQEARKTMEEGMARMRQKLLKTDAYGKAAEEILAVAHGRPCRPDSAIY